MLVIASKGKRKGGFWNHLWHEAASRLPVHYPVALDGDEMLKYSARFSWDMKRDEWQEKQTVWEQGCWQRRQSRTWRADGPGAAAVPAHALLAPLGTCSAPSPGLSFMDIIFQIN